MDWRFGFGVDMVEILCLVIEIFLFGYGENVEKRECERKFQNLCIIIQSGDLMFGIMIRVRFRFCLVGEMKA